MSPPRIGAEPTLFSPLPGDYRLSVCFHGSRFKMMYGCRLVSLWRVYTRFVVYGGESSNAQFYLFKTPEEEPRVLRLLCAQGYRLRLAAGHVCPEEREWRFAEPPSSEQCKALICKAVRSPQLPRHYKSYAIITPDGTNLGTLSSLLARDQ